MAFLGIRMFLSDWESHWFTQASVLNASLQEVLMMLGQMQKTSQRRIPHLGLYASLKWGKGSLNPRIPGWKRP